MRFSLYINQPFALRHGLNVQQALLFSFFYELPSWANSVTLEGVPYYLATKSKIIDELPLLTDKPDTVYRLAKALRDKGLIEIKVIDSKTYYRTTALGATWNDAEAGGFIRGSEKNPGGVGKKSEGGSEKNPTYKYISDKHTNDKHPVSSGDDAAAANLKPQTKTERLRALPDCPSEQLKALYKKHFPHKKQPRSLSPARHETIQRGWKHAYMTRIESTGDYAYSSKAEGLAWWDRFMAWIADNAEFCMKLQRNFDIDWLFTPKAIDGLIDGKYNHLRAA